MKKNKLKLFVLVIMMLLITGCTKSLKEEYTDKNDKVKTRAVVNPQTGQSLTKNIICRPINKQTLEIYEKNNQKLQEARTEIPKKDEENYDELLKVHEKAEKMYKENYVDLDKLVDCNKFKINTNGYEGLWTTIFIKPLAFLILKVSSLVNNAGLAVILVGVAIRLVLYPVTNKTAKQSELIKTAKPEIDKIEKKYSNKNDRDAMMRKSQEISLIYKKYKINPLSGCLFAFIQIPLLFAFLEAINRTPLIFEGSFLGLQLGTTPTIGIGSGNFLYVIILALVPLTTYFSLKMNRADMMPEQQQQMKMMSRFMLAIIVYASFTLPTAIALYWLASSTFTIVQNLIVKRKKEVK